MRGQKKRGIIYNHRFGKMFIKYLLWVFLGITIPLLISEFAVYVFSNVRITEKVDEANERALHTIQTICDSIVTETSSIALRYEINEDVKSLLTSKKDRFPDYRFISLANEVINEMRLSRRSNLDENICIYSCLNDYILCTSLGGQQLQYYEDKTLVPIYQELTKKYPDRKSFYVARKISFHILSKNPIWILTYYRAFSSTAIPDGSFIAMNINVEKLINNLQAESETTTAQILIIDQDDHVLFDTSQKWIGESVQAVFQNAALQEILKENPSDASKAHLEDGIKRINWMKSNLREWRFVQMIPYEEYISNSNLLAGFFGMTILIGLLVSIAIAFFISIRLFRPIGDIIHIMENPYAYDQIQDRNGEIKYLLMNILESFQKNVTLEDEMVKKVADLKSARAKALQEQMTPHFLYNTLQAIHWLAVSETNLEDSKTSTAIITLGEIIRTCMEQGDNLTTIASEIAYVEKFISLEKIRFGDAIQYHYDINPAVLEKKIPCITIQPLVENAIRHGIQPKQLKERGEIGHIFIQIEGKEDYIYICVEDNGVGMEDEDRRRFNELYQKEYVYANQHVGLLNLSQRIRLLYGEEWKVGLNSSQYGGLKVEITIPFL